VGPEAGIGSVAQSLLQEVIDVSAGQSLTNLIQAARSLFQQIVIGENHSNGGLIGHWWKTITMFQEVASDPAAVPGVVITVQSYGDRIQSPSAHPCSRQQGSLVLRRQL
jgi:hypothetical protein